VLQGRPQLTPFLLEERTDTQYSGAWGRHSEHPRQCQLLVRAGPAALQSGWITAALLAAH
jgi:hypothetical protein